MEIPNYDIIPNKHPASSRRRDIMLCVPFEEKRLDKWNTKNIILQPKLDGERCRAVCNCQTKDITLYSSEGNIIQSVPHIVEDLKLFLPRWPYKYLELDGELYIHGKQFEDIHSIVSRKVNYHEDFDQIEYHIFDHVGTGSTLMRMSQLWDLFDYKDFTHSSIKRVLMQLASNLFDIMRYFDQQLILGYEGIIVRHPLAPYERKRSGLIMKFKPHQEDIYKIIGFFEEKDKNSFPKNRLGGFICMGDDGTQFSIGSGFTAEQRTYYWENKLDFIGQYVRVKYQSKTSKRVPRFPIFIEVVPAEPDFTPR